MLQNSERSRDYLGRVWGGAEGRLGSLPGSALCGVYKWVPGVLLHGERVRDMRSVAGDLRENLLPEKDVLKVLVAGRGDSEIPLLDLS